MPRPRRRTALARDAELLSHRFVCEQAVLVEPFVSVADRHLPSTTRAPMAERILRSSPCDRRVTYAVLTDAGRAKLQGASDSHLTRVRTFFEERFSPEEIDQLADLLGRLPGAADSFGEDCAG